MYSLICYKDNNSFLEYSTMILIAGLLRWTMS